MNYKNLFKLYQILKEGKPLSKQVEEAGSLKPLPKKPEGEVPEGTAPEGTAPEPTSGEFIPKEPDVPRGTDPTPTPRVEPETPEFPPASTDEAGRIVQSLDEPRPQKPTTNVNFNRIESEADIDAMIDEAAKQNEALGKSAPRDTLKSMEEEASAELKDILGHDVNKKGIMLPRQVIGARNILVELGNRLQRTARGIAERNSENLPIGEEELFIFRENVAKYRAVMEVVEQQTRLAGQLLGSFRVVAKETGMIRDYQIKEMMGNMGGRKDALHLAETIAQQKSLKGIANVAKQGALAKGWRVLEGIRYNAMLSGPETQIRNLIGNTTAMISRIIELPVAIATRPIRKGLEKLRLIPPSDDMMYMQEIAAQVMAIPTGMIDGLRIALKALKDPEFTVGLRKTGNLVDARPSMMNTKFAQSNIVAKGVSFLVDIAFLNGATRALNAGDLFFKAIAYQMEKSQLAVRQALGEGLRGDKAMTRISDLIKDMPSEHFIKSIDEMHIATFTQDMQGPLKTFQKFLNRVPGASIVIPFFGTLINLTSFAARRTPLALVTPSFYRALAKGGVEADKAIGQAVFGSMLYFIASDLQRRQIITGSGAFLSEETKWNWIKAGWRPNSYLGEDGQYHSIQGGAPFTTIMLFYATLSELGGFYEDDKVNVELATGAAVMFGDIVLDQTFARGLYEFLDVVSEPKEWKTSARARSVAGSFFPNWIRWVRRVADGERREKNIGDFGDRLTAEFMDRIPGVSNRLPPAVTYFGDPPEIGYDAMMVFPATASHKDMYLYRALDRNGIQMRKPKAVIRLAGQDIDLNESLPDERGQGYSYHQWQKFLGHSRRKIVKEAVSNASFRKLDEGKAGEGGVNRDGSYKKNQGDILSRAMSRARKMALKDMMDFYKGTDFAELVKQEMAEGTQEVHPEMPHILRDRERRAQSINF